MLNLLLIECVTKMKPGSNSVEDHPQLSHNRHPVDGALVFGTCGRSLAEKLYSRPLSAERKGGGASAPLFLFCFVLFFFWCFWVQLGGRASLPVITSKGGAFLLLFFLVFFSIYECN